MVCPCIRLLYFTAWNYYFIRLQTVTYIDAIRNEKQDTLSNKSIVALLVKLMALLMVVEYQ